MMAVTIDGTTGIDKVQDGSIVYADLNSNIPLGTKNLIINGDMRIAQRGTSFTADNVYTLDRWKSGDGTGGTPARTLSQQTFTLGQTDVPNAYYYLQHNQTGASTNGNSSLVQKIEDVTQFDGQTITISFYAKADASMNINIRLIQNFGTGGSPSAAVEVSEIVSIGTSWTKYTVTKTLGSLSGKTLGTDGVNTSCLIVNIDFQPTTTFVFDVTLFQLELGTEATPFENLPYDVELARCQRYFEKSYTMATSPGTNTVTGLCQTLNGADGNQVAGIRFIVPKRATPTGKFWSKDGTASSLSTTGYVNAPNAGSWSNMYDTNEFGFRCIVGTGGLSSGTAYTWHYTAEAEL